MSTQAPPPPPERGEVEAIARRGLGLQPEAELRCAEVSEHANINYVWRVERDGGALYVKIVPEIAKRFPVRVPRERVYFEAEALQRFRATCGATVVVPEVLFLDRERYALGLSDVGGGRRVLLDVIDTRYDLLLRQAEAIGRAIGAVHGRTRGAEPFRPPALEAMLRGVVFEGLLAPGAKALFPERWEAVRRGMEGHAECLVHFDLWGKNLLVGDGLEPPGLVDFEGATVADPAIDLATLIAVAVLPAAGQPSLLPQCLQCLQRLLAAYLGSLGDPGWAAEVAGRAYLYTGTMLAARGFGPFAYPMPEHARAAVAELAGAFTRQPPHAVEEVCALLQGRLGTPAAGAA